MAKRAQELQKKEANNIEAHVRRQAQVIGIDAWEGHVGNTGDLKKYGLCRSCVHLKFARTAFAIRASSCMCFEMRLSVNDPITECTAYEKRAQLSLTDMWNMAYLIDGRDKQIGF